VTPSISIHISRIEYKEIHMAKKYPKVLYVFREDEDTPNEFFLCFESAVEIIDVNEDRLIGVYELKNTAKVSAEVKMIEQ